MYDTGLLEELKDIILKRSSNAEGRSEGFLDDLVDQWDRVVENTTRSPGRAFWREMKSGAKSPFRNIEAAGSGTLTALLHNLNPNIKIHVIGHSTGGILIAYLLKRLAKVRPELKVSSCSLMAPACTVYDFETYYRPLLESDAGSFGIDKMSIYNLTDELEKDDSVTVAYQKSLLYLVSNAFEEERGEQILGMQKFNEDTQTTNLEIIYSNGDMGADIRTASKTHGGFDNDPATMNDILKRVLGVDSNPLVHFTRKNLKY